MTIQDIWTTLDVVWHCKDGCDEALASKALAEKAALKDIGKIETILTTSLKVASNKESTIAEFPISHA